MRRRVRRLGIARAVGIMGMVVALVAAVLLRGVWVAHSAPGNTHTQPHTATAPAIASGSCTLSQWTVVSTPSTPGGVLRATAATSGSDVWAAGYYDDATVQANQTLIERWNGTAWSVVPSPDIGATDNQLYGIAALAANDVWAVGYYVNSSNASLTLIEHWNGAQWSVVPSPNPGGTEASGYLAAISAVSAT